MRGSIDLERLVRGEYEPECLPAGFERIYPPPDYSFNVLYQHGMLNRPVADEHFLESGMQRPVWPHGSSFAVCLTHDVDRVSQYCLRQAFRRLIRSLEWTVDDSNVSNAKRIFGALKVVKNACVHRGDDPLHNFEDWLNIEESVKAKSTFFFFPEKVGRRHLSDCLYSFSDRVMFEGEKCTVAELIREIDRRGWEVGLHASWYAFDDVDELTFQKEQLEAMLGHEVVSVRQHFLHYDIRVTPRCQAKAGFLHDSTLGFNQNIGFRFGTSYPFFPYDVTSGEVLPILEIPLIVQDGALFDANGLNISRELGCKLVCDLASIVKDVGGVLTLLWHPDAAYIDNERWLLYEELLKKFKDMGAWITSIRNIGEEWLSQSRIRGQSL